ncbi:MAG TPA: SOS response-associated peptidase [Rhizomicrobium sp.]
MCGKFTQMMTWGSYVNLAELASSPHGFGEDRAEIVSPMRDAFVVRLNGVGQREVRRMRWGLVPSFARDPGIGSRFIHARAESIDTTNAYKEAFRHRRGLVIASEFYEARHVTPTKREPHRMRMEDGSAVALAGIWETWKQPHDAPLKTFAIVTVAANAAIAPVHDRMPAVLAESDWPKWLGETPATYEELKAMLRPCEDAITVTPVSPTKAPPPPRPSTQFDLF